MTHKPVAIPAAQLTILESQTRCQKALAHTLCLYIPLSEPVTHLTFCGLDMLAGNTGELQSVFSIHPEITVSTGFKIIHFHT